ncbi:MAG: ABC transporter ATP-binding protein [Chloroflexi bacterium]|nr:ABC transporter ATP-binding protein [Chloroflexota bacterium]
MTQQDAVLMVRDLGISYKVNNKWINTIRDFHVTVQPGQIVGLVGESGSGKSTVARGVINYLPVNGRIETGSYINFMGQELTETNRSQMAAIWGSRLTLVPQNPGAALNPSLRIGRQLAEVLLRHRNMERSEALSQVEEGLRRVNLPDPKGLLQRFPHELSGGQQQRVVVALAMLTSPELIVLDEPTTALDVTTEAVILDLINNLIHQEQAGAIYVSHNLGVIAQVADAVTVLYGGEIMESAPTPTLFAKPLHPYTIGLLNSVVTPGQTKRDSRLASIAGRPPSPGDLPRGCVYAPRCPIALDRCFTEHPELDEPAAGHRVRCHRWPEIAAGELDDDLYPASADEALVEENLQQARSSLLRINNLTKHFPLNRNLQELLSGKERPRVRAVDGINLSVVRGRTYGLVGESGSGKSSLSRVVIGLNERDSGSVELMGVEVSASLADRSKEQLAQIQMIFQNPQNSLNPYLTVGQAIRRPLMKLAGLNRGQADQEVARLLKAVRLQPAYARRYPDELSGGEKQRVAIARAFASNPELIIADEAVSALDVSVQAVVLNLLAELQEENDTAYIFISHDLAVVAYLADYIAVMYLGQLFEVGYAQDLFKPPLHPYTEALVSSIPVADPTRQTERIRISDNIPSARNLPTGCRFHTRCPHKIGAICEDEIPPWREDDEGHAIRCHIPLDELVEIQDWMLASDTIVNTARNGLEGTD